MKQEKINPRINMPVDLLEERVQRKINENNPQYTRIVSPRDIEIVHEITLLNSDFLRNLLKAVPIRDTKIRPYQRAGIEIYATDPRGIRTGQKFILENKILDIMRGLETRLLKNFESRGLSTLPPLKIYGEDNEGKVISFYMPPIIEMQEEKGVLLDGIHRTYICLAAGTSITTVQIYGATTPVPFTPISWEETRIMKEKPKKEDRYKELNPEYFRDLSFVGIDG